MEPKMHRWREQLRKGGLELAILSAVATSPQYGLQILAALNDGSGLAISEGTIYPLLGRLSREGWLESEWREEASHPRKYYRITSSGTQRLLEMIAAWRSHVGRIDDLIAKAGFGASGD